MRQSSRAIIFRNDMFLVMERNKFGSHFYTLIGGEIDPGESPVEALLRELKEETGIEVKDPRLVIVEDAGTEFGMQYIFLCQYVSGEPKLNPNSIEILIHKHPGNTYKPMWLKVSEFKSSNLLPNELKELILEHLDKNFPKEPINLKIES